jgi:hypothetical protein
MTRILKGKGRGKREVWINWGNLDKLPRIFHFKYDGRYSRALISLLQLVRLSQTNSSLILA